MNDPVEMLLAQAAGASSPFAENSRYRQLEIATGQLPDGRQVRFVRRRFVPQPEQLATLAERVVVSGDRLDNLAQQYYGDPELFWQICDSNRALRPADLTDDPPSGNEMDETAADGLPARRPVKPVPESSLPASPPKICIGLPPGIPGPSETF